MYAPGYDHSPIPDQQQELLVHGELAQPPTSAAHLADRVEASGAKIEETLRRLNCTTQILFFVAAWITIATALLAVLRALGSFSVGSFIMALFQLIFGFIMMIMDTPGEPRWAASYRSNVKYHMKFLTRLTGKSLWFLYLGSMIAAMLLPSATARRPGLVFMVGLVSSLFVIGVGLIGLVVALQKSLRLEKIRQQIISQNTGKAPDLYRKYAITDPRHGIQFEEFNRMCADHSQGRCKFDVVDLAIIFAALDPVEKAALDERQMLEWIAGPMKYL